MVWTDEELEIELVIEVEGGFGMVSVHDPLPEEFELSQVGLTTWSSGFGKEAPRRKDTPSSVESGGSTVSSLPSGGVGTACSSGQKGPATLTTPCPPWSCLNRRRFLTGG